jgi:hypothetical protein
MPSNGAPGDPFNVAYGKKPISRLNFGMSANDPKRTCPPDLGLIAACYSITLTEPALSAQWLGQFEHLDGNRQ